MAALFVPFSRREERGEKRAGRCRVESLSPAPSRIALAGLVWRGVAFTYLLRLGRCRHVGSLLLVFAFFSNGRLCSLFLRREDVTEAEAGSHQGS